MSIPKNLICLDSEGIFKPQPWDLDFNGPLDSQYVKNLVSKYADIYIVSEHYPKNPDGSPTFALQNKHPYVYLNLQECYNSYWDKYDQEPATKLYVSNTGNYHEAVKAEFTYVKHELFINSLEGITPL